jgi:N-acetylmuramoyl-L-alanine amidase
VKIEDAFVQVPARNGDPHVLVVQMKPLVQEKPITKEVIIEPAPAPAPAPAVTAPVAAIAPEPAAFIPQPKPKPERFTIVIDPGHGGVDPGAIGALGTKEKDVTLRYAKHLRELLRASPRYEVVMTRDTDTYVSLKGRVEKARKAQGHLFISLHADSHPEPTMRGLSVYTLSEKASDKEAEALAERENKKDIITGVDLSAQSKEVAEVLIDLVQRDTKNTSARFAELVVAELGTEAKLLKNTHRFAGFAVLKGVGIPSALVELGYLSNPKEEAQLIRVEYEDKLVHAIARAVDTYCDQYVAVSP